MADHAYTPGENRLEAIGTQGEKIAFYLLTRKFVDSAQSIPEEVKDVLYYTLAVGHHTGVMDCFERKLDVDRALFTKLVDAMPSEAVRSKWLGVLTFGEIEVGKERIGELLADARAVLSDIDIFNEVGKTTMALTSEEITTLTDIIELMLRVQGEVNVYLMVRRVL